MTKLKNLLCKTKKILNCDNSKTQIVMVIKMAIVTEVVIMPSFIKNTLTPWQPTNSQGSFLQFLRCFYFMCLLYSSILLSVICSEMSCDTHVLLYLLLCKCYPLPDHMFFDFYVLCIRAFKKKSIEITIGGKTWTNHQVHEAQQDLIC